MAATIDFGSILSAVADVVLEFLNVNDIAVSAGEYCFELPKELKDGEDPYLWVRSLDNKNKRHRCSIGQLAALRIFKGELKDLTADWTKDFRALTLASNFQDESAGKTADWVKSLRLVCVKQLAVLNTSLSDGKTPVYKRTSYKDVDLYNDKVAALKTQHGRNYFQEIDGKIALKALRVSLECSGLKPDTKDTDRVLIPVFILK
jgi:hypothetical protein